MSQSRDADRRAQTVATSCKQLDGQPDKVTNLHAAVFKGSNQNAALNIAISCLEKVQRGNKEPALDHTVHGGHCMSARPANIPQDAPAASPGTG